MKKSNKILVAGFLTLLLFITALHLTLYAKYKSGDYTIYNPADDLLPAAVQSFPNILFVSVRDIPNGTVQLSDVAQVDKNEKNDVSYIQKGDTLLIAPKDSTAGRGLNYPVAFRLPANAVFSVSNSSLTFKSDGKVQGSTPVVYLKRSYAFFSGSETPFRLGKLNVVASEGSSVLFEGNTQVNQLAIQLSNSAIDCSKAGLSGQLSIVTDSISHLSLQANQFLKADIKTTTPQ